MCGQFPLKALTQNLAHNYVTPKDYKLGFTVTCTVTCTVTFHIQRNKIRIKRSLTLFTTPGRLLPFTSAVAAKSFSRLGSPLACVTPLSMSRIYISLKKITQSYVVSTNGEWAWSILRSESHVCRMLTGSVTLSWLYNYFKETSISARRGGESNILFLLRILTLLWDYVNLKCGSESKILSLNVLSPFRTFSDI